MSSWLVAGASETVYSIAGRLHRRSGYVLPAVTSDLLFARKGAHKDIHSCSGMIEFARSTADAFGTPSQLMHRRTVLGTWLRFARTSRSKLASGNGSTASADRRAPFARGLLDPQERHWLRFCPQCAAGDEELLGERIWRAEHQIPGTAFCALHMRPLLWLNASGGRSASWIQVPAETGELSPLQAASEEGHSFLLQLSQTLSLLHFHASAAPEVLRTIVITALREQGISPVGRSIAGGTVQRWWRQHPRLEVTGRCGRLLASDDWPERLLTGRDEDLLKWAVLLSRLGRAEWIQARLGEYALQRTIDDEWEALGVRRGLQVPNSVVTSLESGACISDVAASADLKASAVRHWLRLNPEVRERRLQSSMQAEVERRRVRVERHLLGGADRAELMRLTPADVRWLAKNDGLWLAGRLRAQTSGRFQQANLDLE